MSNLLAGALAQGARRLKRRAEMPGEDTEAETGDDVIDAEGEENETGAEGEGEETEAEGDGEETDAEDDGEEVSAHGRSADFVAATTRCRKILTAKSGEAVPTLAATLAFERLDMSAAQAIAVMDAAAADAARPKASGTLGARMAGHGSGLSPAKPVGTKAAAKGDNALLAAAAHFKRPAKAGQ